jgi:hypothetical protein
MTKPRRRADLIVGELKGDEETALLDPETTHVVSLNATAAAIWYLCDGNRDVSAIAGEMSEIFPDVTRARLESEVASMIETFAAQALLA